MRLVTSDPHSYAPAVLFDEWKARIQAARTPEQIVAVVREYLASWPREQLDQLPWLLSTPVVPDCEAIIARAVVATRAELQFEGPESQRRLLREMAWTLAAAATRLRFLLTTGRPALAH